MSFCTGDDTRAFLRSARTALSEQRRCEHRLSELRAQCERVTASYGGAPSQTHGDRHKDALLAELADQRSELSAKYLVCARRIHRVEEFISLLPDRRHRAVLRLVDVDGLRWHHVADELHNYDIYYSIRQAQRLYGEALKEARRAFPAFAEKYRAELEKEI